MPSFSDETVEQWRRERVLGVIEPKIIHMWSDWQIGTAIDVAKADIAVEEMRLVEAEKQIAFSRKALAALRNKKSTLEREKERRGK